MYLQNPIERIERTLRASLFSVFDVQSQWQSMALVLLLPKPECFTSPKMHTVVICLYKGSHYVK